MEAGRSSKGRGAAPSFPTSPISGGLARQAGPVWAPDPWGANKPETCRRFPAWGAGLYLAKGV
jgi:hypothetical protein